MGPLKAQGFQLATIRRGAGQEPGSLALVNAPGKRNRKATSRPWPKGLPTDARMADTPGTQWKAQRADTTQEEKEPRQRVSQRVDTLPDQTLLDLCSDHDRCFGSSLDQNQ